MGRVADEAVLSVENMRFSKHRFTPAQGSVLAVETVPDDPALR